MSFFERDIRRVGSDFTLLMRELNAYSQSSHDFSRFIQLLATWCFFFNPFWRQLSNPKKGDGVQKQARQILSAVWLTVVQIYIYIARFFSLSMQNRPLFGWFWGPARSDRQFGNTFGWLPKMSKSNPSMFYTVGSENPKQTTLGCFWNLVNNSKQLLFPQLVTARFLNHQQFSGATEGIC